MDSRSQQRRLVCVQGYANFRKPCSHAALEESQDREGNLEYALLFSEPESRGYTLYQQDCRIEAGKKSAFCIITQ